MTKTVTCNVVMATNGNILQNGKCPNVAISDTKGPLRKQQCRWIDERGGTGLICVADAENATKGKGKK